MKYVFVIFQTNNFLRKLFLLSFNYEYKIDAKIKTFSTSYLLTKNEATE